MRHNPAIQRNTKTDIAFDNRPQSQSIWYSSLSIFFVLFFQCLFSPCFVFLLFLKKSSIRAPVLQNTSASWPPSLSLTHTNAPNLFMTYKNSGSSLKFTKIKTNLLFYFCSVLRICGSSGWMSQNFCLAGLWSHNGKQMARCFFLMLGLFILSFLRIPGNLFGYSVLLDSCLMWQMGFWCLLCENKDGRGSQTKHRFWH